MNFKPIIIVVGEPYSVFSELIFRLFKKKFFKKNKNKIIFVGSAKLLKLQMEKLKYKYKINVLEKNFFDIKKLNKKSINIINVNFKFKKVFDKISNKSTHYINESFDIASDLIKKKHSNCLINGPISKKFFLNKRHLGITEFLKKKSSAKETTMLIYNKDLAVSPITTHLPLKRVAKNIKKKKIVNKVTQISKFYNTQLNLKPNIAVLGLNPHCETIDKYSEEEKIIIPAIKDLKKRKIKVNGPFSADTFFLSKNLKKFDVVIGMYHDQVLTPIKTLFKFKAINITLGLPYIRISPDHGPNNEMVGKNKSNADSLYCSFEFLKSINEI